MSDPERVQLLPDGTRLPIPEHPRYQFCDGAWCWRDSEEDWLPIASLYKAAQTTLPNARLAWEDCCAVAACAFRQQIQSAYAEWAEAYERSDAATENALLQRVEEMDHLCAIWESELAKAEGKNDRGAAA